MATCKDNLHVRDKLVELLIPVLHDYSRAAACMEYLLANGVTVQEEGYWIGEGDGYADGEIVYDVWYCGNCGYCIDDGTDDYDMLPNFCPNCGMKKLPLPTPPKGE